MRRRSKSRTVQPLPQKPKDPTQRMKEWILQKRWQLRFEGVRKTRWKKRMLEIIVNTDSFKNGEWNVDLMESCWKELKENNIL